MTTLSWALAAAFLASALTDWWAVWTERPSVRHVFKPLTLVFLIGVALTLDPFDPAVRAWLVVGLVFGLGGDVFLMLEERFFIAGLGSFLLGHLAYVVALVLGPTSLGWALGGLAVVVAASAVVGRRIVGAVAGGEQRAMAGPVAAYLLVISAMVVAAFATAAPWAIVGALLFYASDAILGWNRFVEPRRLGPISVMVTYHLGQAGLVAWLVTG